MSAPASTAAWLLTYAVHSTVLLGAAALLTARWVRAEAWRDTLWKAALVGGLVTATAQAAVGWSPLGGRVAFAPSAPSAAMSDAAEDAAASVDARPAAAAPIRETESPAAAAPPMDAGAPTTSPMAQPAAAAVPVGRDLPVGRIAVVAWAMIALALLARVGVRQARLQRMLRGREDVADPRALGTLAALRRHAGYWRPVRLTVSRACPTPLALGGGEICVPPRFLDELDPEQQRSALAHELAHLARRDPSWHFGAALLEAVFFFQPLNRLARVRLRESAEYLCDEWAARQTGAPLHMARCLAEVASWVAPGAHPVPAGTMAMAEGGSPLARRVERMLDWRGPAPAAGRALRVAAAAVLVAGVAAVAPAVAASAKPPVPAAPADAAAVDPTSEETTGDAEAQEVIRHPRPSDPLADRWTWGMAQAARRGGAWVAFSVPTVPMRGLWYAQSGPLELSELSRAPVGRMLGVTGDDAILLFRVDGGQVRRVAGRGAGAGMRLDGAPVAWLGEADAAEAFAHLRAMADAERDGELREALVEAIAVLPLRPAVGEYLGAVLGRDRNDGVRREAAAGLARHPRGSSKDALLQAIARDGSDGVRREAVEALGRMDYAPAGPELRRLATSSADAQVRRQAVESLGERGDPEALDVLAAAATRDPDPDVRRQAVESLERFPADRAIPALVRIAWPRDDEAARQAAESLGTFADRRAIAALDSLARRHPKDEVARQAAESLGHYPSARPLLERIARTHPDPTVRAEAADQLAQHPDAGQARPSRLESMMEAAFESVDPDPDPNPDLDVDVDPDADPDPDPSP